MVNLSVTLAGKLNDEAAAKLAFSLRHSAVEHGLVAQEALLCELFDSFVTLRGSLEGTQLLLDALFARLGEEADLEALVVCLCKDGCELSLSDLDLLLVQT